MRSLSRHINDIVSDDRIVHKDIIGFTETQINLSDSPWKITETWIFFSINLKHNGKKLLSSADRCRNDAAVLYTFDADRVSSLVSRNMLLPTEYSLLC